MIYILIFILTLADLTITGFGIASKRIDEANPIMAAMYDWNIPLTILIVGTIVGLLIWFISKQKIRWLGYAAGGLLIIKIGVMFLHANWISQI